MTPLFVLIVVTVTLRVAGARGCLGCGSWPTALRGGLAAMFVVTGGSHFVGMREDLISMVPPALPDPGLLVTLTGVLELAGAVGLLWRRTAPWAAAGLSVLLVAMFPANVYAALEGLILGGAPAMALIPRTLLQVVFLAATLTVLACRIERPSTPHGPTGGRQGVRSGAAGSRREVGSRRRRWAAAPDGALLALLQAGPWHRSPGRACGRNRICAARGRSGSTRRVAARGRGRGGTRAAGAGELRLGGPAGTAADPCGACPDAGLGGAGVGAGVAVAALSATRLSGSDVVGGLGADVHCCRGGARSGVDRPDRRARWSPIRVVRRVSQRRPRAPSPQRSPSRSGAGRCCCWRPSRSGPRPRRTSRPDTRVPTSRLRSVADGPSGWCWGPRRWASSSVRTWPIPRSTPLWAPGRPPTPVPTWCARRRSGWPRWASWPGCGPIRCAWPVASPRLPMCPGFDRPGPRWAPQAAAGTGHDQCGAAGDGRGHVMAPVHMGHGGAGLRMIGIVISFHTAGMYALSPVFGCLADRRGRCPCSPRCRGTCRRLPGGRNRGPA